MSSSSEIRLVATITPTPGKEAQVREALIQIAKSVHAEEKGVAQYQVMEQVNATEGGVNVFIIDELYANEAAHDAHFKTDHFQALTKAIQDGGLASAMDIRKVKVIGGFSSR